MSDEDDPRYRFPHLGEPGRMRLGQGVISPQGILQDYEAFPGDEPNQRHVDSDANRWGARLLFQINQPTGQKQGTDDAQSLIDIRTLKRTTPLNVQIRFALCDVNLNPILPFTWRYPFTQATLFIKVRRSSDLLSSITEDNYTLVGSATPGSDGAVFPGDIITTQKFSLDATLSAGSGAQSLWVEAIATPVTSQAFRDVIRGYPQIVQFAQGFTNAGPFPLLNGRADRASFIVENVDADAPLYLFFTNADGTGSLVNPAVVVYPNTRYESPIGGWTGAVLVKWIGGTKGTAYVTEGLYHTENGIARF